jgi:hypothetical protein
MESVKFLNSMDTRILKQINIINDKKQCIGNLFYKRKLSDKYKFKEIPEEEKDFKYYLEYPKQAIFPNDNIDGVIIQSIKKTYNLSELYNHSILTNADIGKLNTLINKPIINGFLTIAPDISGCDYNELTGKALSYFTKEIHIYSFSSKEEFNSLSFFGYFDYSDIEIPKILENIEFI